MELNEAIAQRRSVRAFKDQPLSEEQTAALLEAFTWAPSPLNQQPWEFILVKDPDVKRQVTQSARQAVRAVADGGGPGWAAKYDPAFLEQAPLLIAVLYDPKKGGLGGYFDQPHGALSAASAGIQNLCLAATEMGLGALWFTFFNPKEMARVLGVPQELEFAGIIPVGAPAQESKTPPRKPPKAFTDRYGE